MNESVEIIQTAVAKGTLSIRPYVTGTPNMGLEKYEMVVFPGITQTEPLTCIQKGHTKRYLTGLDEFAPEIRGIKDPKVREARIKQIRETVVYLEKALDSNPIDVNDPDFWGKVKVVKPNNSEFWDTVSITCGNEPVHLDPADPMDLIRIVAIEAGGFNMVAKSFTDAKASAKPPMFYLDRYEETISNKVEIKKLRNKAIVLLDSLFTSDPTKLFYVCKLTDANGHQYKKRTPLDVMYDNMDRYINGQSFEKSISRAANDFIKNSTEYDQQTLKLKALCKDAVFYKLIYLKPDGMFYHTDTNSMLGRNLEDIVAFLASPMNEDIMSNLMSAVEKIWNE